MTLFKQIVIVLSFFQMIIFGSVLLQNFNTVNDFVQTQLGVDARHTANSLGLSITPYATSNDIAMIETMINSMFDGGYYESITLKDINNKVLIKAKQPVKILGIPSWFKNLFILNAPMESSEIMAGWSKFGTLSVKNNVGIAYNQLWQTFKDISFSFIILNIFAFSVLYLVLKAILRPLEEVHNQAKAITGNDFILQKNLPKTIELRQVVGAMNGMVGKVKEIFEKEAEAVEKYHNLLYKEESLNIFNKRYFVLKLNEFLGVDSDCYGSIVFVNILNHDKIKPKLGFEKNELLHKEFVGVFKKYTDICEQGVISQTKEDEFAFLLPDISSQKTQHICDEISEDLKQILAFYGLKEDEFYFSFGIIYYNSTLSISDIFSKADFALSMAKSKGKFNAFIHDQSDDLALGKEAWRKEILNAIDEKRFLFAKQKVISANESSYHEEIFLRLEDKKGAIRNAAYFMPMVEELQLNENIDQYVLKSAFNFMQQEEHSFVPLCINLGKEVLTEGEHLAWIENILKENKIKNILNFEVSHRFKLPVSVLANFSRLVKRYGHEFGLDNFNIDGDNLKTLQDINPNYIKVPAMSLLDLLDDKNAEYSKQSLDIITSSMNINIIAFGVSTNEDKDKLLKMGINYMQGSFIQEPYLF